MAVALNLSYNNIGYMAYSFSSGTDQTKNKEGMHDLKKKNCKRDLLSCLQGKPLIIENVSTWSNYNSANLL